MTSGSSNNKVLTVSYGAFSCSLEGFDDSFDMMKLVMGYFREVAEENPAFGSFDPELHAAALARASKEQLAKDVEGTSDGAQVILRPSPSDRALAKAPEPKSKPIVVDTAPDDGADQTSAEKPSGPPPAQPQQGEKPTPPKATAPEQPKSKPVVVDAAPDDGAGQAPAEKPAEPPRAQPQQGEGQTPPKAPAPQKPKSKPIVVDTAPDEGAGQVPAATQPAEPPRAQPQQNAKPTPPKAPVPEKPKSKPTVVRVTRAQLEEAGSTKACITKQQEQQQRIEQDRIASDLDGLQELLLLDEHPDAPV